MSEKIADFARPTMPPARTMQLSAPRRSPDEASGSDFDLAANDPAARKLSRGRRRERAREDAAPDPMVNVVQLALPPMPQPDQIGHRNRNRWLKISALVCIALPAILASIYYAIFAADQYAAEVRFAVRSNDAQAADVLGVFAGMPSTTVISDSYILADYIRSSEMVKALEARIPLREIFSRDDADFLTRLDPSVGIEDLVDYWADRVRPVYDATKNTISIQVRAFSPQDAATVLGGIVDVSRDLINNLSAQARQDAVKFAAHEVELSEERVRTARAEMLQFRTANNELDPTQSAAATLGIASQLDAERSRLRSQLAAISTYLAPDAPSVQMLRSRIAALDTESASVQGTVSSGDADSANPGKSAAMANVVGEYQEVLLNQEFAEKAYAAALASLERARIEADRQQSYLAIYVSPSVPEEALYPKAILNTLAILVMAALAWALGALIFLTVRDHVA